MFGKQRAETVSKLGDGLSRALVSLVVIVVATSAAVAALVAMLVHRG